MSILQTLLLAILNFAFFLIIVEVVASWLIAFNVIDLRNPTASQLYRALRQVTEPILGPIRRILPNLGGIDFSPFVALLLIMVLQGLVTGQRII